MACKSSISSSRKTSHDIRDMAGVLRPSFFIVRDDGTKTPLVAVDELPQHIRIIGVPSVIGDAESQDMVNLGTIPRSGRTYTVQQSGGSSKQSTMPDRCNKAENEMQPQPNSFLPPTSAMSSSRNDGPSRTHYKAGSYGSLPGWARTTYDASLHKVGTRNVGERTARDTKVYCIYWLRRGECDYMQQGCRYKHEMPTDKETLAGLGFRELPRWYREQSGSQPQGARLHDVEILGRPERPAEQIPAVSQNAPTSISDQLPSTPPFNSRQRQRYREILSCPLPVGLSRPASASPSRLAGAKPMKAHNAIFRPRWTKASSADSVDPILEHLTTRITKETLRSYDQAQARNQCGSQQHPPAAPMTRTPALTPVSELRSHKEQPIPMLYAGAPLTPPAHTRRFVQIGQEHFVVNPAAS